MKKMLILLTLCSLVIGIVSNKLILVNPFKKGHGITVAATVYKHQENRIVDQKTGINPLPITSAEQQLRNLGEFIKINSTKVTSTKIRETRVNTDRINSHGTEAMFKTKKVFKAAKTKGKNGSGSALQPHGDSSEPTDMINGDSIGTPP